MQFKKIAFTDVDGVLRGKYINKSKFDKGDLGFCNVVFGWDSSDQCYDTNSVTGWNTAFPDGVLTIDTTTRREVPWEKNTPFYLADFSKDETLKNVCPRSLLKSVINEYHKLGLYPKAGFEYEWFNFHKNSQTINEPDKNTITRGMFGYSLLRLSENKEFITQLIKGLSDFKIEVEGLHTETGPGVYEIAMQYTEALEAADQASLFKYTVKEIGLQHDILASFMSKWNVNLPGCGCHIHISLHDKAGKNLMTYQPGNKTEDVSTYFLEGILKYAADLLPVYAPTINSYKRLVEGSWAATTVSYGYQNRTTAVRLIANKPDHHHVEFRIPGADVNPYLALYSLLSTGLESIKNKTPLTHEEQQGNAYSDTRNTLLAKSLEEAVDIMEKNKALKKVLNPKFLDHFILTRKWEIKQYQKAVTDWEIKRYLEII
ncbi:glutamine synthetase family protein [Abyssalbus ytuae]|uniref:Glutamine synthetase family protein n=1 Tax=Abyssalbus ytuae TaxID=2926907 RepID=A0A9E6ZJZ3_9FLAO|nr:glutamine synthetase family protein [Abyssalbus ytuae]UOB17024.1 glutamine synthetase family protein [Abyssalbus ytuae]